MGSRQRRLLYIKGFYVKISLHTSPSLPIGFLNIFRYLERRDVNKSLVSIIASIHEEATIAESKTITVVILFSDYLKYYLVIIYLVIYKSSKNLFELNCTSISYNITKKYLFDNDDI